MTSKKAASLSSALLARKGSAVPAGLSETPPTAGAPLPNLLSADTDKKNGNGNGHFHPISLEPPRKSNQAAKLGCDDPLQPPLIPGLTTQTGPTFKADAAPKSGTPQEAKDPGQPAAAKPEPSPKQKSEPPAAKPVEAKPVEAKPVEAKPVEVKPAAAETPIKAAPPLRPKAPIPSAPRLEQDYPQPPKPRATPEKTDQPLVAERRTRPETAPSAARLAAAAAGRNGEPMPMPALAAIATVVALTLVGAAYLFFSDKGTTTAVAEPPAEETTTVAAAAEAAPAATEAPPTERATSPSSSVATALSVAAGDSQPVTLPTPQPTAAIEPVTHLAATQPPVEAAESGSGNNTAIANTATAAIVTAQPVAADDGPEPAPPRPTADTSNIVPTAAGAAPLPTRKPERLAALNSTAGSDGGGRFAVQLASVPSAAAAEREIRRLKRAYPTLFGAMPIDVQRSRGSYRLMSQRFENRGEAADLCQSLKDAGRGCLVLAR